MRYKRISTDAAIVRFCVGLVALAVGVKCLKNAIKQRRPNGANGGMPSARAALVAYAATTLLLTHESLRPATKATVAATSLALLAIKYVVKEHSVAQLAAGASLGAIAALLLFRL